MLRPEAPRPLGSQTHSNQPHTNPTRFLAASDDPLSSVRTMRAPVQAGRRGRSSFVPPNRFRQRPFWPAGIRTDAAIPVLVVDVHGKQKGAIYQEVTFGRSDIAPVSLLVEDRADVLECLINGKHGDHSSHLHPYAYRHGCMAGAGALVLTVGRPYYP